MEGTLSSEIRHQEMERDVLKNEMLAPVGISLMETLGLIFLFYFPCNLSFNTWCLSWEKF
jgi:hypothetical protein